MSGRDYDNPNTPDPYSRSALEDRGRKAGVYYTADELLGADFPEPKWAVSGLIAEGLTLLVGAPKLGKSWLCLGLAVAIATGGRALGKVAVDAGTVLYCALEDTPRRLQGRLLHVLGDEPPPTALHIVTVLGRGGEAIDYLSGWLDDHPDARLVIIDVLAKIRPPSNSRKPLYETDYEAMSALKSLADRHGVAVVCVHHTRKSAADDVLDEVSGSTGMTGGADAVLVAKRARNTTEAVLSVTGRDITEHEYALTWWPEMCQWTLLDEPAAAVTMSTTRRQILAYVTAHPGASPKEITDGTGLSANTVKVTVRRMAAEDGQLDTDGKGRYTPRTPVTRVTAVTQSVTELHQLLTETELQRLHIVEGEQPT